MRRVLAVFYFTAGVLHLAAPERFLPMAADFVPMPHAVVLATGPLRDRGPRRAPDQAVAQACWRHAGDLRRARFPSNIEHAIEGIHVPPLPDGW
jgi:uncharacterized membrane protein